MEDVLQVYQRPYDPRFPVVCLDEASKQLIGEITPAHPPAPGKPARVDYEYERNGTCNEWHCRRTSECVGRAPPVDADGRFCVNFRQTRIALEFGAVLG
jgi:hypothetical protein